MCFSFFLSFFTFFFSILVFSCINQADGLHQYDRDIRSFFSFFSDRRRSIICTRHRQYINRHFLFLFFPTCVDACVCVCVLATTMWCYKGERKRTREKEYVERFLFFYYITTYFESTIFDAFIF